MLSAIISLYMPNYTNVVVYMFQSSEYQVSSFLKWYWSVPDFSKVRQRGDLKKTLPARLLLYGMRLGMVLQIVAGIWLLTEGIKGKFDFGVELGLVSILIYPIVWANLLVVPLFLGRWLIIRPRNAFMIYRSEKVFSAHIGVQIAIVGSYGKTTMKEVLKTVLSEGKKVAATPANRNVASSHAQFAKTLKGDEDVLIIEYGEGAPGDVAHFAKVTHPSHAVITGVAPAHLDKYKTLEAAGKDIFSVAQFVPKDHVYVNQDSPDTLPFMEKHYKTYSSEAVLGWRIKDIKVGVTKTNFVLARRGKKIHLTSHLVGLHQVGTVAFAAALALELGLSEEQVIEGVAQTAPFEHRMAPYNLNGAWIIDDTYNGNLEGIRAGTGLLAQLPAKHKMYVTPGLVDQGKDTAHIHEEVGEAIAMAKPDTVVLMKNSVTEFIKKGLENQHFQGKLRVEPNPLKFYTNLDQFVASGDLVVMQNDWPDQYK